jgi:16S rRNA (cytosine1402-N4)-methyltransferase
MKTSGHEPVLLEPALRLLDPRPGEVAVDCTLGAGGHALALARAIGPSGVLVGFDVDPGAVERIRSRAAQELPLPPTLHLFSENFVRAPDRLRGLGLRANVVLADLGFSSVQMDDAQRGFSFSREGPLDMRLDPRQPVSAADLLASLSERDLARLIGEYGEDPLAGVIARKVAQIRGTSPIQTTTQLARLVEEAYGPRARRSRLHPATRTFMALRIAINDELGALRSLLDAISRGVGDGPGSSKVAWLNAGARIALISFHSLEDRLIKRAFADLEKRGMAARLTRRPVTADDAEIDRNPRARSAKLRVARMATPAQS